MVDIALHEHMRLIWLKWEIRKDIYYGNYIIYDVIVPPIKSKLFRHGIYGNTSIHNSENRFSFGRLFALYFIFKLVWRRWTYEHVSSFGAYY